MQEELTSLTYVSRAAHGLDDDDVFRIYQTAMQYNTLDGVTGLLIFDGTYFMQIVEGSQTALDALLARMSRDARHHELNIVDQRTITQRSFADWSMKLVRIDRAHMQGIDDLASELGARVQPEVRAMLLDFAARMAELA